MHKQANRDEKEFRYISWGNFDKITSRINLTADNDFEYIYLKENIFVSHVQYHWLVCDVYNNILTVKYYRELKVEKEVIIPATNLKECDVTAIGT